MNIITKHPVKNLGYDFVDKKYLPKAKDEYYLRNEQNKNGIVYRQLTTKEKEMLRRAEILLMIGTRFSLPEYSTPPLYKTANFSAWCALVIWNLTTRNFIT